MSIIAISILAILMLVFPFIVSKVNIENTDIKIGNNVIGFIEEEENMTIAKNILDNNTNLTKSIYMEIILSCAVVSFILMYLLLNKLEKLFINIYKGDTPFTLENVSYIKDIAKIIVISIIFPVVSGLIMQLIMKVNLGIELEIMDIILALIIYCISYIFEYGYEIQLDSKGKMYGDEKE